MTTTAGNPPREDTRWPALAASPTFALMALVSALDVSQMSICGTGANPSPLGSMTVMYLLMTLFHLAPWLKLARRH
ncbi:hypothetical protein GB928_006930 [Shinella curvata]|uniref:Uncharacterized protein n=1 Tax=Shinella curvata TaxID=1817964 RepID=A0ABT8XB04_9HYPH|nr:hypothetical protein [Shinella curvata]MCJ8054690.1 hypothetical protein [Shinella curvata]MDO6120915.1 hypothetical protein [Shinella curvata]